MKYESTNPLNVLCTGCGACISESSGSLSMQWNEFGFLAPKNISGRPVPDMARKVCPFNPQPEAEVRDEDSLAKIFLADAGRQDTLIGSFENTYIGYSKAFRETSSSGGIATYVFKSLLEQGYVDHLFVVQEGERGGFEYKLFSDSNEIHHISKTRYFPVTLEKLFDEIGRLDGRVGVSGVACFIKAIRLKQYYQPKLKEKIPFLVGIICGGWKSRFFTDFLAQSSGIQDEYHNPQYRVKDANSLSSDYSFSAEDSRGNRHLMKMHKVGDMWGTGLFKNQACDFCTDVLTELADISLGDAWLPEYRKDGLGNSVIVTRSALADKLILSGIASGDLQAQSCPPSCIIESQRSSFSHRHDGLQYRVKQAQEAGLPIPALRERVMKKITPSFAFVQRQRDLTRRQSLLIWRECTDVTIFNQRMRQYLKVLKFITKVYHKLKKFRL